MAGLEVTSDHLVPIGLQGAPTTVTVTSGSTLNYSASPSKTIQGTIAQGASYTFAGPAWVWSTGLSEIDVESTYPVGQPVTASQLPASVASAGSEIINVSESSGDVAAITAAITAATSGGYVSGKLRTQSGSYASITSATTISLGYSDTNDSAWNTQTAQKVKLALDILPAANLGAALTIKGGYGVELDINVLGGGGMGTVTDAATVSRTTSADGAITANSGTLTSSSASFTSADIGSHVIVPTAGNGIALYATILSINSSTSANLDTQAYNTVSGQTVTIISNKITSPNAVSGGVQPGAVIFFSGAGPSPEGVVQPLAASVRSINGNTLTLSEAAWTVVASGGTMNWFDVAVRLEDHVGLKINVFAKDYAGYVIAADATDGSTRALGSCTFGTINGNQCGGTIFWKGMGAFGSMGKIWSNSLYGDYFGACADLQWDHYEGGVGNPSTYTATSYLWFDRCNQVNDLSISLGDRASEALLKISGDSASSQSDIGRFAQIRCTGYQAQGTGSTSNGTNTITGVTNSALTFKVGQYIVGQGVPDGAKITAVSANGPGSIGNGWTSGSPGTITFSGGNSNASVSASPIYGVTTDGLKMIGCTSAEIGFLDTTHMYGGCRIVGGGANGIKIRLHRSLSYDYEPLVIQPGTSGTPVPRVDIKTDYRFHLYYSASFAAGLGAANIKMSGHLEGMHVNTGASGLYAINCGSSSVVLDTSGGLDIGTRSGLSGLVNPAQLTWTYQSQVRDANNAWGKGTLWVPNGSGATVAVAPGTTGQVPTYNSDGSLTAAASTQPLLPGMAFTFDPRGAGVAAAYAGARVYGCRVVIPTNGHITSIAFCLNSSGSSENFDLGVLDTSATTRNRLDYGPGGTSGTPVYTGASLPGGVGSTEWVGCGSGLQFAAPSIAVTAGQQVDLFLGLDNTTATVVRAVTGGLPTLPTGMMAATGGGAAKTNWAYTTHFYIGATIADSSLNTASVAPLIVIGIS